MKVLLVIYDNDSYIHWFPQGMAYIAAVLEKAGHEVVIYSQDVNHYPEEHLTRFLDQNRFDVIGLSFIAGYYQYRKAIKISEAINLSKQRPFYIIGGHGPAPEPGYFIEKTGADVIVIGEGEITVVDLLETLEQKKSLSGVKGIAYMDGNTLVETPRRHLIADVDSIPMPAYKLFQMEYYRLLRFAKCSNTDFVIPMLSGRGCPFKCTFCYRMDKGFRPRKSEGILEEMRLLNRDYGVNYFLFSDDLLMSSVERTMEISEAILSSGMRIKWHCNGRLNYATPDVLKAMKKSGCVFINYGIEAMDDRVLKNMHKALTTKQVIKGIEATISEGISPGLNIIFGNIGDNRDTLNKGVEFLLKYDDGAQMRTIRPVTPYPGSPLYYDAIEKGLLKDCRDFYEHKHLNSDLLSVNFTELSDEDFYDALCEANLRLVDNYYSKKQADIRAQTIHLYHDHDQSFRGFRQT